MRPQNIMSLADAFRTPQEAPDRRRAPDRALRARAASGRRLLPRGVSRVADAAPPRGSARRPGRAGSGLADLLPAARGAVLRVSSRALERRDLDRKSTRLNSSHVKTSYAVFCLTKK